MATNDQDRRRSELATTSDPRAARTRERIVRACAELVEAGGSLSVEAVSERAGVGRSTFYTHFAALPDVAEEVVDRILDEIARHDIARRSDAALPRPAIVRLGLGELIRALRLQRRYVTYLRTAPAMEGLRRRIGHELARNLRPILLLERPDASEDDIRSTTDFIVGGTLELLLGWLDDPGDRSEDAVVEALVELMPPWLAGAR